MNLNGEMILVHGGAMALGASALVLGALAYNPRLFIKHFPERIRAMQRPLSVAEKRAGTVFGVPLFMLLVGAPIISTIAVASGRGVPQDPVSLWTHAFLVGMVFNVFDWLVIDEVILGLGKPRWALPSGVTLEDVMPFDHGRHFADFLKGVVFCAGVALIASVAAIAAGALGMFEGTEL